MCQHREGNEPANPGSSFKALPQCRRLSVSANWADCVTMTCTVIPHYDSTIMSNSDKMTGVH